MLHMSSFIALISILIFNDFYYKNRFIMSALKITIHVSNQRLFMWYLKKYSGGNKYKTPH